MSVSWDSDKAEKLWLQGVSATKIFRQVGAPSRSAVLGHINRRGLRRGAAAPLPARSWTEDRTAEAKRRWLAGDTAVSIAEAIGGVTGKAVGAQMLRLGLQRAKVRGTSAKPVTSWGQGTTCVPLAPSLELVAQADAPAPTGGKTLAERGPRECCWPIGSPDPARGQLFCAAPTGFRQSYCSAHSPNQSATLRTVRLKDETVRRARPDRDDCDIDLTELFA